MTGLVARWSDRVVRVLAPNPSPMTLEGTNTYVVGDPAAGSAVIIDPGPALDEHLARVEEVCAGRRVALVLLTHTHVDHAEGARELAARVGAPVAAVDMAWRSDGAPELVSEEPIEAAGVGLIPVLTPGHAADHCCFLLPAEWAMFTGDHVLGRGSTVVEWPGGDMRAYLRSLEVMRKQELRRLYPGHGPVVHEARDKIEEYITHRLAREAQVVAALGAGYSTPAEIVARIYTDVDPSLHPAAELSVRAHLAKLTAEHRAAARGDRFVLGSA